MAQFIAFDKNVEVNGQTVLSVVNGVHQLFKSKMFDILAKNNIYDPEADKWYKQTDWLQAFKEIAETIGDNTLFSIGKQIPENAIFPKEIDSLKKALESIDIAYHMNHRGGEIGYYKLIDFHEANQTAMFECKNPYPCHFDRGILTTMVRKFSPASSYKTEVILDSNKKSRIDGNDSSFYIINW